MFTLGAQGFFKRDNPTQHNRSPRIIPILYVTELKNTQQRSCTQLKKLYQVISSRFIPNLVIFQTIGPIARCKFRNKPYASKEVQILPHISQLFKQKLTFSAYQHSPSPFAIKLRRKRDDFSPKSLSLDVETAFLRTFPSSDKQCLPPGDPRVLCV